MPGSLADGIPREINLWFIPMIFGLSYIDIALIIVIGVVLFFAVKAAVNRRKKSSCCGSCSDCSSCSKKNS